MADRALLLVLIIAWFGIAIPTTLDGWSYYQMDRVDRAYSDDHAAFKPSGTRGHAYGIYGTLMMAVGVVGYSLRRRWHRLEGAGPLRRWLRVHIFLCTLGPYLVLLHTAFNFGGIVAISFWSMAIVVLSGVVGRYVHARIPRRADGRFVDQPLLAQEEEALLRRLAVETALPVHQLQTALQTAGPGRPRGLGSALWYALRLDLQEGRLLAPIISVVQAETRVDIAAWKSLLTTHFRHNAKLILWQPFTRIFGLWHVIHIPLALLMLVILIIHIAVATLFGYGLFG